MYDLQKEFEYCKKYMRGLGIEIAPDEKISIAADDKLKRGYGICEQDEKNNTFEIRILPEFLNEELPVARLHEIIMHELLHTRAHSMNHGKHFQRTADMIKQESGGEYGINDSYSNEYLNDPSLQLEMQYECGCGATVYMTGNDQTIRNVETQYEENKIVRCPICRKRIEPGTIKKCPSNEC